MRYIANPVVVDAFAIAQVLRWFDGEDRHARRILDLASTLAARDGLSPPAIDPSLIARLAGTAQA